MATGEVSFEGVTFSWKIPGIISILETYRLFSKRSPSFSFANSSWNLQMYCDSLSDLIEFHLNLESTTVEKTVDYELYLEKINGEKFEFCTFKNRHFKQPSTTSFDFPLCVTLKELRGEKRDLVQSGALIVMCRIKESKSSTVDETTTSEELLRLDTLSSDFRNFFTNKQACDVCLRVQEKEFQVHRAILTARSSVFAAMFNNDTSEKESGIVTIPDCDPDSFEDFLKYLYTGSVEKISCEKARQLYVTADKYDVKELREFCVTSMTQRLAVENVCDVVTLADLYEEAGLLSSCQIFFTRNFKKIMSSAEWKNLMKKNYNVASEMLEKMASMVDIIVKKT